MLYCAMSQGEGFGWGTASTNLLREFGKLTSVTDLNGKPSLWHKVPGCVFHTIKSHGFETEIPCRGEKNVGYGFWEYVIPTAGIERAKRFDLIFSGSTWGRIHLRRFGIESEILLQGINPEQWHGVGPKQHNLDYFVVASIGKFELRKGQDIAMAAMKAFMDRHKDVLFVNAWENKWRDSILSMETSRFIEYRHMPDAGWQFQMAALYMLNNMHQGRIDTYPLLDARNLAWIIQNSDVGLFTNRCEAGTNLALMEYMACGKPAIASYNSGHRDILTSTNAILLSDMTPFELRTDDKELAKWEEPNIEEVIEKLEWAYQNRDALKKYGKHAAEDMKKLTWEQAAKTALLYIEVSPNG